MRAGQPLQGPGAQGFVLLGLWQPARAVALGSAPWLGVGVGALGGLSRVSAHGRANLKTFPGSPPLFPMQDKISELQCLLTGQCCL